MVVQLLHNICYFEVPPIEEEFPPLRLFLFSGVDLFNSTTLVSYWLKLVMSHKLSLWAFVIKKH